MASKLVRVEVSHRPDVHGYDKTPWIVEIRDEQDDLTPLAGFAEESEARSYSAKLDAVVVSLQRNYPTPDWVELVIHLHDEVAGLFA